MALWALIKKSAGSALRGGIPGAIAMVLQVVLLMWLRTTINYQYRHGGTITDAFNVLYAEGGVWRFYQGAQYALIQGPLSRFGDTAANEGVKEFLSDSGLSVAVITFCASVAAALFRIILTPVDTLKTTLQVSGAEGMKLLGEKVTKNGFMVMFDGALGNSFATLAGHYPWYATYNYLDKLLPAADSGFMKYVRNGFNGWASAFVSDCVSNGIRVVKTYKQTHTVSMTYLQAAQELIASDGIYGLFTRGLGMKLISNGISSILFTILWKMLMDMYKDYQKKSAKKEEEKAGKKK